jgi:hypothetical protein
VSQRRGRRPEALVDPTPPDGDSFDGEVRIGWLLRSSRLHRAPVMSARAFAATLAGLGLSVDATRLSRWETGRLPAPLDVVAGYERALDLPSGGLVALAIITRKLADPGAPLPSIVASHRVAVADAQAAVDAIVDGRPTGEQWLRFANHVVCSPAPVLLPASTWQSLAHRLVRELVLSVGTAYATRNEAATVLAEHPRAAEAMVRAVAAYVLDGDAPVVADAVALLRVLETDASGELALTLLDQSSPATRAAAVWCVATKVLRGHFTPAQVDRLEDVVARRLAVDPEDREGTYHAVADLLDVLPAATLERIRERIGTAAPTGQPPRPDDESTGSLARNRALAARVARTGGEQPDPMLDRLVEEALFHPDPERRFHTSFCLALSPYADQVARGTGRMLEHALFEGPQDRDLASRLLLLLTFVPTPRERGLLHRVARESDPTLSARSLNALGHLPAGQGADEEVLRHVLGDGANDEVRVRAALYAAGMTGTRALVAVDGSSSPPEWVRSGARWWRREGPAIREPARWEA